MMMRPSFSPDLSSGLLCAEHFQLAWATNDIGAARNIFAQRYGVKHWTRLNGQLPTGGHIHVELAWVGGVMAPWGCAPYSAAKAGLQSFARVAAAE